MSEADPGSVKRGGRESKFLDAAPENKKNRPKKQKSAEKGGGGRFGPPLDPPLHVAPPDCNAAKLRNECFSLLFMLALLYKARADNLPGEATQWKIFGT